jgi:hypothetical protein
LQPIHRPRRRQVRNTEAERQACEIWLRAERRAGELLAVAERNKGAQGNPGGRGAPIVRSHNETAQTLSDLGISKSQSSRWQQLAAVPEFVCAAPGHSSRRHNFSVPETM